ncbi:hypothetical protein [Caldimonas brevitalea]|uniref:Glutaredoxin n=1 Tax=Caldimonas brevitalea TaxID=413882 RepID=A0A0G3BDT8_9BURK|nr:hypothetical protein [Caldimonas brevitalea]AKJ27457.1 hypothetical protein AAW51_0766 [Caldimonas brevitalea]
MTAHPLQLPSDGDAGQAPPVIPSEDEIDESLRETFPASDPSPWTLGVQRSPATRHEPSARGAQIAIYGRRGSATARAVCDFLDRHDAPFDWIELVDDEQARLQAGVTGLDDPRLPVCVFPDGSLLACPTLRQLADKLD